jgi:hypothetical protein
VALGGRELRVLRRQGGEWRIEAQLLELAGTPLVGLNALNFDTRGRLLFSEGSQLRPRGLGPRPDDAGPQRPRGPLDTGRRQPTARPGPAPRVRRAGPGRAVLASESWRHRVIDLTGTGARAAHPLSAELVGYPSRMAADADGGFWLSCFVCRSQLVEFVLREPAYRERMVAEIDPRHWIAPALSSGHSFLEPLQGAGVKQMGVLKPWAPPRSYGLVMKIAPDGRVLASLHSQVDGHHHGITALAPLGHSLYVAARGAGRLLRLDAPSTPGVFHDPAPSTPPPPPKPRPPPATWCWSCARPEEIRRGARRGRRGLSLRRGEIHALLGENGAGKSTLTKIMAGVVTLSEGQMWVQGRQVQLKTPLEARDAGIAMVFQETSLVPTMTVAQNLFLGRSSSSTACAASTSRPSSFCSRSTSTSTPRPPSACWARPRSRWWRSRAPCCTRPASSSSTSPPPA